jgi:hypothetical protein
MQEKRRRGGKREEEEKAHNEEDIYKEGRMRRKGRLGGAEEGKELEEKDGEGRAGERINTS